jgi:hypothetical protein
MIDAEFERSQQYGESRIAVGRGAAAWAGQLHRAEADSCHGLAREREGAARGP